MVELNKKKERKRKISYFVYNVLLQLQLLVGVFFGTLVDIVLYCCVQMYNMKSGDEYDERKGINA